MAKSIVCGAQNIARVESVKLERAQGAMGLTCYDI